MRKAPNRYFVYIFASRGKVLYTGVTGDLFRRVRQHRNERGSKFTPKYRIHELVWFEEADDVTVTVVVAKEKQVKSWHRRWKMNLVEFETPRWLDLATGGRSDR